MMFGSDMGLVTCGRQMENSLVSRNMKEVCFTDGAMSGMNRDTCINI